MKNLIGVELGKKIKMFRARRKLTQEQLAEFTKTSYKYIQRIEGKNPPDIRLTTIEKLARALKTSPSKLLEF
jgi:transcriptional regulator with XRE-family HTH domain